MSSHRLPLLLIVAVLASLVACGQKGPLVLPQGPEAIAAPTETEGEEEESDSVE